MSGGDPRGLVHIPPHPSPTSLRQPFPPQASPLSLDIRGEKGQELDTVHTPGHPHVLEVRAVTGTRRQGGEVEREDQAAGASKSPMPVILSGQLQTPGPTLSTLAFSLRESDQPCPCTPALSTRFHFDPRFQMQPGAAATSLSSLSPFLTSWSCPSPARPRSHRPVENMPRVKSTQAPERSESANPPASIPPRVGSRARRLRPASRNRSPRRRSPAPLRPRLRPCALGHPPRKLNRNPAHPQAGAQAPPLRGPVSTPPARCRLAGFPVFPLLSVFWPVSFLRLRGFVPGISRSTLCLLLGSPRPPASAHFPTGR